MVATVIGATGSVVFQTVMMLIALFFLLVDGARLVGWLDRHVPLRPGLFRELIEEFRKTSISVLTATLATAGIQTLTALVGYLIARAPNLIFFALATFVIALVPALGGAFMVVAVGLVLLATGTCSRGRSSSCGAPPSSRSSTTWPGLPAEGRDGAARRGGVLRAARRARDVRRIGLVLGPLIVTFLLAVLRCTSASTGAAWRRSRPLPQRSDAGVVMTPVAVPAKRGARAAPLHATGLNARNASIVTVCATPGTFCSRSGMNRRTPRRSARTASRADRARR